MGFGRLIDAIGIHLSTQSSYSGTALAVQMGGGQVEGHLHMGVNILHLGRNTVSQEDDGAAQLIDFGDDLIHIHGTRRHLYDKLAALPLIHAIVDLIAAGIHDGADGGYGVKALVCHGIQGGHRDQRHSPGQPQPLGGGGADAQAGERTGAGGDGDGIDAILILLRHAKDLVDHGQQSLGMGLFKINGIFGGDDAVLPDGYRGH